MRKDNRDTYQQGLALLESQAELIKNLRVELAKRPNLDSRDFYEVMQQYRHDRGTGAVTFENVKAWLRNPTYEFGE